MLDKILSFIAAFMAKTTTTTKLTPAIGTGSVYVMQFGKVVLVAGQIDTTTALANGDILITGLPAAKVNNALYTMTNNNSSTDFVKYAYISNENNTGRLRHSGTAATASRSLRISLAYIAS